MRQSLLSRPAPASSSPRPQAPAPAPLPRRPRAKSAPKVRKTAMEASMDKLGKDKDADEKYLRRGANMERLKGAQKREAGLE